MNIGDYVRTKDGIIGKIESKNYIGYSDWLIDTLYYNDDVIIDGWTCGVKEYNILKSSPNIIDLIEVGDYVNGYEVTSKDQFLGFGNHDWYMINDEVKSIVTKEQFKGCEYKL